LYVTHDQLEAMTLADRLVVMNGGLVEQIGTPTEVYDRPETLFVAGFIGSPPMNLIPVASLEQLGPLPSGTDIVGIRPDSFVLEAPATAHVAIKTAVELIEPVGGESHVHVSLLNTGQSIVLSIPGRPEIIEGSEIIVYAPVPDLHPFSSQTSRRTDIA